MSFALRSFVLPFRCYPIVSNSSINGMELGIGRG